MNFHDFRSIENWNDRKEKRTWNWMLEILEEISKMSDIQWSSPRNLLFQNALKLRKEMAQKRIIIIIITTIDLIDVQMEG